MNLLKLRLRLPNELEITLEFLANLIKYSQDFSFKLFRTLAIFFI